MRGRSKKTKDQAQSLQRCALVTCQSCSLVAERIPSALQCLLDMRLLITVRFVLKHRKLNRGSGGQVSSQERELACFRISNAGWAAAPA
jgi:hypothetical protein